MKIKRTKDKAHLPPRFSGKVKLTIQGIDQHSQLMSGKQGLKAHYLVLEETTIDEVYAILVKALEKAEVKEG